MTAEQIHVANEDQMIVLTLLCTLFRLNWAIQKRRDVLHVFQEMMVFYASFVHIF